MRWMRRWLALATVTTLGLILLLAADSKAVADEKLVRHRNLGKAFYENPTTQNEAVEEFRQALAMAPNSVRERLNFGLALLRAGKTKEGIAELEKVQKQDPSLPHTWFNLGIESKKAGEYDKAQQQFEQMIKLAPDEPISHYNLGVLYKLDGKAGQAIREFETASRIDPNLAAPHFQLFNMFRQAGRREDAARRLETFQQIKKQQEGAAVPEDVEWSFYSEVYEVIDPAAVREDGPGPALKFAAQKLAGRMDAASAGLLIIDVEADGHADLLSWSANGVRLYRRGSQSVTDATLAALKGVVSAAAGDFDNDGLTDLCVLTQSGPVLLRNNKGGFQRHASALPQGRFETVVWLDYDHDYDLDLLLLGAKSVLYRNQGEAGFADRSADFPFVAGHALSAAPLRLIADSKAMDLAVTYRDRAGLMYRDKLAGKYEAVPLNTLPAGATGLTAADLDNDSWLDLAYLSGGKVSLLLNRSGRLESTAVSASAAPAFADLENHGKSDMIAGNQVFRNLGMGKFLDGKVPAGFIDAVAWTAADFNGDGRLDLAAVATDGSVNRLLNQTAASNQWLRVSLTGVKNLKLAWGAEIEVKAGRHYQKKIYEGLPLLFGLRGEKQVDTVRITWANGLIQNEPRQTAQTAQVYKEAQRLSGSCPMIWTWNGKEFEFITDVLGVAPLGASAGDGTYFPVDHDEYIQIAGESLALRDGSYEIRITEELAEVAYLDQVKLIAADHPSNLDIFTNEKFQGPPFPGFRLFGVSRRLHPVRARDDGGRDVRPRLVARDRVYPDQFSRTHSGVAGMHALELDFGRHSAPHNRAILVLNGWVDWADGSTFLGRAQESSEGLVPPYLQVKDAEGRWRTVLEDMGMPAGKPKTIVADLTGKFLSPSREIRIVTNLCVYWDEIFLSEETGPPQVRLTALKSSRADLKFRGFSPVRIHPERKQPEMFSYARPKPASMWNPTPGLYTRYGDVHVLTHDVDDRFVIMGSGDELRLLFDASSLPELPHGWRRDFLLLVDGWAKDRDANTAFSQTVEPLPFHGMSSYPYPASENYPDDAERRKYRTEYNTRPALRLIRPLASAR